MITRILGVVGLVFTLSFTATAAVESGLNKSADNIVAALTAFGTAGILLADTKF